MSPVDYLFEIIIAIGIVYGAYNIWVNFYKICYHTKLTGDEIMERYLYLKSKRSKK